MTGGNEERSGLDLDGIVNDEPSPRFQPKTKTTKPANDRKPVGVYPSREAPKAAQAVEWAQLNFRAQASVVRRFKQLAKARGLKHYALLEQALDAYEEKQ